MSKDIDELEQLVRDEIKAEGFNPTHTHVDSLVRRFSALIAQREQAAYERGGRKAIEYVMWVLESDPKTATVASMKSLLEERLAQPHPGDTNHG